MSLVYLDERNDISNTLRDEAADKLLTEGASYKGLADCPQGLHARLDADKFAVGLQRKRTASAL